MLSLTEGPSTLFGWPLSTGLRSGTGLLETCELSSDGLHSAKGKFQSLEEFHNASGHIRRKRNSLAELH